MQAGSVFDIDANQTESKRVFEASFGLQTAHCILLIHTKGWY